MQHPNELTPKERFIQAVTVFLQKSRIYLLSAAAAVALFIVVYAIVTTVQTRRTESSTILVERVEDDFESWAAEEDEDARKKQGEDLLTRLDSIISDYGALYAGQRALFLRGSLYYQVAEWDSAIADFIALADRFQTSYMAPISLVNAAAAAEQKPDYEAAITYYDRVLDAYGSTSPEIPLVLFSLGRVSETAENPSAAVDYYQRLVDDYPSSGWTNLARSRIIALGLDEG